jgi:hypothetical protein
MPWSRFDTRRTQRAAFDATICGVLDGVKPQFLLCMGLFSQFFYGRASTTTAAADILTPTGKSIAIIRKTKSSPHRKNISVFPNPKSRLHHMRPAGHESCE